VAQECQHACECELSMFREFLQATVSRQEHIVAGDPCCRYRVQSREARKPARERRWPSSRTRAT
jgi:predicted ArsR family transcriptional regulator